MGVAAPVYDHADPVAGIGVAAPLARIPPERMAGRPSVVEAASGFSAR